MTELLAARVLAVPDHPQPGIVFRDVTPLLADAGAFRAAIDGLAAAVRAAGWSPQYLLCPEARGFLFGAPLALALGAGFVPVRKPGKLPWQTVTTSYDLEYGTAEIELHEDGVRPGQRVLVVDDVLATGGTAAAACELVERIGIVGDASAWRDRFELDDATAERDYPLHRFVLRVRVTDPKWLKGLKVGQGWGTTAFDAWWDDPTRPSKAQLAAVERKASRWSPPGAKQAAAKKPAAKKKAAKKVTQKTATKKAPKKATKKATKKTAAKKTAKKTAAKKAPAKKTAAKKTAAKKTAKKTTRATPKKTTKRAAARKTTARKAAKRKPA